MSLVLALNNALTGMNISQQSLAVLSQNIANANTQGYSRKVVDQQAIYLGGNGAGVSIADITRKVDGYLQKSVRLQSSTNGKAEAVSDYMDRTQLLLGKPGSVNNINAYIGNYFNSLQSLAQTPENTTLRVNAVNSASTMAQQISQLASDLQELRYQADQDIKRAVDTINENIVNLHALNETISNALAIGRPVTELLDRRDELMNDIAQYIDIQTYEKTNGRMNIFTANGISLLDESIYQLTYNPVPSAEALAENPVLAPVLLYRTDDSGNLVGNPTQLVTGGKSNTIVTPLQSGKLKGMVEMRDRDIPNMLNQLDQLAANMRDQINAVHNRGVSFPGNPSLTGTRAVYAEDFSQWTGEMRLALLGKDGAPIPSPYEDETSGMRPLTLDLSTLNTGNGAGYPSVEGIINEINQYYGIPQNKAVVGNLNNIRLASNTESLPGSPPQFSFDLDIENISAVPANVFVTNVQVLDSLGAAMTPQTSGVPTVAIDPSSSFVTTAGSNVVTVNTTAAHGFDNGDKIYLSDPGADVDGIPQEDFNRFFTIANVTPTSFEIIVDGDATAGGTFGVAGQTATPSYVTVEPGEYGRTGANGYITTSLGDNSSSPYYLVKVDVAVDDGDGDFSRAQLTYRIFNNQSNMLNDRTSVENVTGNGQMVLPNTTQAMARAMLVDENGVELPRFGGQYTTLKQGYLKIQTLSGDTVMALDSLDSVEQGKPNSAPPVVGTGRGFSHFFELNNFFETAGTDDPIASVTNSALNLKVEQRLIDNPNLISLGTLIRSAAPSNSSLPPLYTYERNIGDNSFIQQMAAFNGQLVDFPATGGLGQTRQTFSGYAGQIIGAASTNAASAQSTRENAKILMDGFAARSDSISGVNLDEELANTIIYQNAYTASTRVITVANELFDTLIQAF